MWHDNETTVDYLNFGVVADACASLLKQANGEPISIGVSGGWGAGKSSLVKMIASARRALQLKGRWLKREIKKSIPSSYSLSIHGCTKILSPPEVHCYKLWGTRLFGLQMKIRLSLTKYLNCGEG